MRDDSAYGLDGRTAIVTGSGSGIGRGIALEMANAGADVVVAEFRREAAEETAARVRSLGRKALVAVTDVTSEQSVAAMMAAAVGEFGGVDILVNNVGGLGPQPKKTTIIDLTLHEWDSLLRLNLTSQFICSKAFISHVVDSGRKGSIVNIASLGGLVPYETSVVYGAAKAGVVSMTMTLASEYGKRGIRVNCIAPGHIRTPIPEALYKSKPELRAAQDRIIPVGRWGEAEEIGRLAVFLASEASSYVTGQTIVASGGMTYFLTKLP
ncbi:MAG: SDR family oxidoreductase [Dehalococcoidia bacterium]|jgi:NAD(P)-dependent dehydrogenase (short-subunit alcohol dehydrogenase family)|nr:SDR family oxidoreductase [Dehalococcoidia bacterium]